MAIYNYLIFAISLSNAVAYPGTCPFTFVSREEWGAKPSGSAVSLLSSPVSYVVIHHSYDPPACEDRQHCIESMQFMQNFHQIDNGWQDIGYNFGVGGDGAVYEGRGWQTVGAHAVGMNTRSIGIVLIGDFVKNLPPRRQLNAVKKLIAAGVALGYISEDYQVVGHRQVSATECPGQALYTEISSWKNYAPVITS